MPPLLRDGTQWIIFGGVLVVTWALVAATRWVMTTLVRKLFAGRAGLLEGRLVQAATTPVRLLLVGAGLRFALDFLAERVPGLSGTVALLWAEKLLGVLMILAVTATLNAVLNSLLNWYLRELASSTRATWDEELLPVVRRLLSLLLYFIAVSIILKSFGQDITALVTTAGVASLAIALAAQETLSNMLGGIVILVDRPFKSGDVIELADGKSGEVTEIGLRSTRIRLSDGNALVVPNRDMASSRIVNLALPNQRAAIRQTIGVSYDTDMDQAKALLLQVLQAHPDVLKDPAPGVWFTKFNESSLDLVFSAWVESYRDRSRITDQLNSEILKAFREAHIGLPYPQRDVNLYVREGKL